MLGVPCCGVGGAEIDGTTSMGDKRLWLIEYCGPLPAWENINKINILNEQEICTQETKDNEWKIHK